MHAMSLGLRNGEYCPQNLLRIVTWVQDGNLCNEGVQQEMYTLDVSAVMYSVTRWLDLTLYFANGVLNWVMMSKQDGSAIILKC